MRADSTDRKNAQEDLRFSTGGENQWDARAVRARRKSKPPRPVLTENKLGPSIGQIVNDGRQNKPSILCTPKDGGTPESSEYFQGRIRQLEYECDADVAYDTAREYQVRCGRGFYRVVTRYRNGKDGEQYACIEPINDPFTVVWDDSARREDLEDADWWFVVEKISEDEHDRRFGADTVASKHSFYLEGANPAPAWMGLGSRSDQQVQIASYYYRDYDETTDDGSPTCKICTTNGVEVLDETEWLDPRGVIPIMAQWGKRLIDDTGQLRTYSLIYDAKDAQKLVNLYVSLIAEQISMMPKNPYRAPEGSIAGRESEWETINEVQRAVIQYKSYVNGQKVDPPSRENSEPPIQALVTGYLQAVDAVKAAMGIFDASLGAGPGDTAGVAIEQRRSEADVANFHFSDNESRARKKLGRILLRILPLLDGAEPADKAVRTVDGKVRMVRINESYIHANTGKAVIHDMEDPGEFEIAVSSGPSYLSQRDEENHRIQEVIKSAPELLWVLGDLYFATSDGPGADEMADRMKRAIAIKTPGMIDPASDDPRQQLQHAAAQASALAAQNQQMAAELQKAHQIIATKQVEADSKYKIEALRSWTALRVEEIQAGVRLGVVDAQNEGTRLEQMFDHGHDVGVRAMEHAHTLIEAQQQKDLNPVMPPDGGPAGAPAAQPQQ
jgi:hypothetical protein